MPSCPTKGVKKLAASRRISCRGSPSPPHPCLPLPALLDPHSEPPFLPGRRMGNAVASTMLSTLLRPTPNRMYRSDLARRTGDIIVCRSNEMVTAGMRFLHKPILFLCLTFRFYQLLWFVFFLFASILVTFFELLTMGSVGPHNSEGVNKKNLLVKLMKRFHSRKCFLFRIFFKHNLNTFK